MALEAAVKRMEALFEKRPIDERSAMAQNRAVLRKDETTVRPVYDDRVLDKAETVYDTVLRNAGIACESSFSFHAKKAPISQPVAHKHQGNTPVAQKAAYFFHSFPTL